MDIYPNRELGISTIQHPPFSNYWINDTRPIKIKPNAQLPCYSTDRWALAVAGLLVHPLHAWGQRLIWRWAYNNPPTPAPLRVYRTSTLQTCENLQNKIYTSVRTFWIISVHSSPRSMPKLTCKNEMRGDHDARSGYSPASNQGTHLTNHWSHTTQRSFLHFTHSKKYPWLPGT